VSKTSTLKRFGDRLKELRRAAGLSQEKLAELAELHRTYISGVERGERNASLTTIARIAKALDISLSELFEGVN
jgi:transcriptional regulator with XRE-family HTH domain